MTEYRVYCLNSASNFSKSHEIEAADDAEVLVEAKGMKLPVDCELRERGRMVAELPAHAGR